MRLVYIQAPAPFTITSAKQYTCHRSMGAIVYARTLRPWITKHPPEDELGPVNPEGRVFYNSVLWLLVPRGLERI